MGVWQGVTMDSHKSFTWARHAQPFYAPRAGHPCHSLMAVSGVTRLQGGRSAAVFYPLGHPTPYAYLFLSAECHIHLREKLFPAHSGFLNVYPGHRVLPWQFECLPYVTVLGESLAGKTKRGVRPK
jgi:hypothetical protein